MCSPTSAPPSGRRSLLNLEPTADVYEAVGYPLTRRAATLADEAQRLADAGWTWGDAVEAAMAAPTGHLPAETWDR